MDFTLDWAVAWNWIPNWEVANTGELIHYWKSYPDLATNNHLTALVVEIMDSSWSCMAWMDTCLSSSFWPIFTHGFFLLQTAWCKLDTCLSSSLLHSLSCDPNGIYPQTVCLSSTQFVEVEAITALAEMLYNQQRHYIVGGDIILMNICPEWHKTNTRTSISSEGKSDVQSEGQSSITS